MVIKELEGHKNAQSNEEEDDDVIKSKVIWLIKEDVPNPSNGTSNTLSLPTTSCTTQVAASKLALKSSQKPGKRDDLDRKSIT